MLTTSHGFCFWGGRAGGWDLAKILFSFLAPPKFENEVNWRFSIGRIEPHKKKDKKKIIGFLPLVFSVYSQ